MPLDVAKRGTLDRKDPPLKAIVAANDNYEAGYHEGDPGGLDAVDTDLAAGNIKDGVVIFGKTGTVVEGALAEDVEGDTKSVVVTDGEDTYWRGTVAVPGETEVSLALKNLTFNAASLAFAAGFACVCGAATHLTLRLYMGGVLMQTSGVVTTGHSLNYVLRDFKVLSGSQDCELKAYNSNTGLWSLTSYGKSATSQFAAAIAVGSVKLG